MPCRAVEQLELALEDLLVAVAEDDDAPIDEGPDEPIPEVADAPALRRRPRVSEGTLRERRELDPGTCCPDCPSRDIALQYPARQWAAIFALRPWARLWHDGGGCQRTPRHDRRADEGDLLPGSRCLQR